MADSNFNKWFLSFSEGKHKLIVAVMMLILLSLTAIVFVSRYNQRKQKVENQELVKEAPENYEIPKTIGEEAGEVWDDYQTTLEDEELLTELELLLKNESTDTVRITYLIKRLNKYFQNEKN